VVLDINLPDMLGFDVCRRLKNNRMTCDIPVIHISATYPTEQFGKLSVNSGASRFIEHPNDLTELVGLVQQELQKHQHERGTRGKEQNVKSSRLYGARSR
jgi:DNA-binding response OmpR family regulator